MTATIRILDGGRSQNTNAPLYVIDSAAMKCVTSKRWLPRQLARVVGAIRCTYAGPIVVRDLRSKEPARV